MRMGLSCPDAAALVKGGALAPGIHGTVEFYQTTGGVIVKANISGLPDNENGFYGFHIHQGTDCSGVGFQNTGGHYNPSGTTHPHHAGDLPPLLSARGEAYLVFRTDRFTVGEITGHTVVIHSKADDFTSQPAGNAGEKIACGIIQPQKQAGGRRDSSRCAK